MPQLVAWDDLRKVKRTLAQRLRAAKRRRDDVVAEEWRLARGTVFGDGFSDSTMLQYMDGVDTEDFDISERIDVKYAFRNLRLIHSHMSSNPPVATARPESPDVEDRRAAKAAENVMRWMLTELDLHDKNDLANLDCLVCGTGITYTSWDTNAGDIECFDRATGEVTMKGALSIRRVSVDDFWPDADAISEDTMKHSFERIRVNEEEARSRWPDKWMLIKRAAKKPPEESDTSQVTMQERPQDAEPLYDLYLYFEAGRPENGMLGRFCVCTEEGVLIEGPDVNPNLAFPPPTVEARRAARRAGEELPKPGDDDDDAPLPTAYSPYQFITDIDVQDRFWGRSALYYVAPAQRLMASIDSATLEAVKAHGKATLLLPPGMKLPKDGYANTSLEILTPEDEGEPGRGEAKFIQPFGLPPAMTELRASMRSGIDDMWGVNENMFGQQSRETSQTGMQYSVNQGAMVRRRLFNKSVRFVRNQYKALLSLVVQHWDVPEAVQVLGPENAYDVVELMGMDLYCGYRIDVEYGTHLPLDPESRRDMLLKYMPIYQQAGVSQRSIVSALGMADLEYMQSLADLARDRAKEIIDRIIETGVQQEMSSKFQDHEGILAYMLEYVNTADFEKLDLPYRLLIDDHIDIRRKASAAERTAASGAPGGGAATPGPGGGAGGGSLPGSPAPGGTPGNPSGADTSAMAGPAGAASPVPPAQTPPGAPPS